MGWNENENENEKFKTTTGTTRTTFGCRLLRTWLKKVVQVVQVVFKNKINCLLIMKLFDNLKEKAWQVIKRKAVEVIVAILTAAITALTTTSCMGHGPF